MKLVRIIDFDKHSIDDFSVSITGRVVGLIEGGCSERGKRTGFVGEWDHCDVLVSLATYDDGGILAAGTCGDGGGGEAYLTARACTTRRGRCRSDVELPLLLDQGGSRHEVVKIDYLPGCPRRARTRSGRR
ncbi:MAG: hypothetical protein R3B49_05455 [Phycisphaerales bacterium]